MKYSFWSKLNSIKLWLGLIFAGLVVYISVHAKDDQSVKWGVIGIIALYLIFCYHNELKKIITADVLTNIFQMKYKGGTSE